MQRHTSVAVAPCSSKGWLPEEALPAVAVVPGKTEGSAKGLVECLIATNQSLAMLPVACEIFLYRRPTLRCEIGDF